MSEIERRLARLEDRAELGDLVVRYFLAADGDDLAGLRDAFAEISTFSVSGAVGGATREDIIEFLVAQRTNMGLTLHTPNYGLFTFKSDVEAAGLVGAHLELVLGGVSVFGAVRYRDTYVRESGAWRIKTRDMRTIHMAPWADAGEAFASPLPQRWPGADPAPSDFPRKA
jgi:hypothetical protein